MSVLITGTILGQGTQSAWAVEYPSWADVQAARNNVAAKEAEITRLDSLLASLQTEVTTTQAVAEQKGAEYQVAQQKYDESAYKAGELQKQADVAHVTAEKSKQQAGQLAAQLARSGGSDLTATLFFSGSKADGLLSQLGLASMVKDQSAGLYQKAIQDENSAQSLTDQANRAKDALRTLKEVAQKALEAATAASKKATAALSAQEANKTRLEAQRATLVENKNTTESDYNAGVQAAIAAAIKLAAEYAAAHPRSGGGPASAEGWVRPAGGQISSPYGWRVNPYSGAYALHAGTDLASGCNSPIFAAHTGTVIYAGPSGGYGNFVMINNGDGVLTAYGHIVNGGILVSVGEQVGAGQNIARVGSTGNSTGCHLHFEVRPGGIAVDPVPYLRARGIDLTN